MHSIINNITAAVTDSSGVVTASSAYISAHYGDNGVIAAWITVMVIALVLAVKLIKLTFKVLIYLALPALALAFLGSMVFPVSFTLLLPITSVACSLFFLMKS